MSSTCFPQVAKMLAERRRSRYVVSILRDIRIPAQFETLWRCYRYWAWLRIVVNSLPALLAIAAGVSGQDFQPEISKVWDGLT